MWETTPHDPDFRCCFVSFSESLGHLITYKVLKMDTKMILYRYKVWLARTEPNLRAAEESQVTEESHVRHENPGESNASPNPVIHSRDFLMAKMTQVTSLRGSIYLCTQKTVHEWNHVFFKLLNILNAQSSNIIMSYFSELNWWWSLWRNTNNQPNPWQDQRWLLKI